MPPTLRLAAAFAALSLAGCAVVPKDAGFPDVQRAVAERTNHAVQWRGHTADDAAVDAAVARLLHAGPLSADDAVQVALLNNLSLQATYGELGIAQADLVQAGLLKNPTLYAERRFSGQAAEFDLLADFLDLLYLPLRKNLAAAEFDQAKQRVGHAVIDTAADAKCAYYELQASRQMLELRRTIEQSFTASADAAQKLYDAGNTNLLALQAERRLLAQAKLETMDAEADVVQRRERLNVLMGLWGPAAEAWTVGERLPDLPVTEIASSNLESLALRQRLDLAADRQNVIVAGRALGLVDATRYFTDFQLGFHYEHEIEGGLHSMGPSLELQLPIFDQGQAGVARSRAILQQAAMRYAAAAIDARSAVRSAYSRMDIARRRATYLHEDVLPLSADILHQTQLQYNGMYQGVFSLLEAKREQMDAGRKYVDACKDYWVARSELERAVGGRLSAR